MAKVEMYGGLTFQMRPDSTSHGRAGNTIGELEFDATKPIADQVDNLCDQAERILKVTDAMNIIQNAVMQNQIVNILSEFDGNMPEGAEAADLMADPLEVIKLFRSSLLDS